MGKMQAKEWGKTTVYPPVLHAIHVCKMMTSMQLLPMPVYSQRRGYSVQSCLSVCSCSRRKMFGFLFLR